ncbi:hypothetical protein BU14_0488s0013 [Porphyra umbilicalis]|uniref:Uncharacterized protein n=1 Tax=Porphyra umbilicalis TaxID=2786 RepID=A0A1X6NTM5_PORUM|nr:hypothetical protein BU14_0488s0013 [Porphyra umbilicalis]|eukprot:OSX71951.1 hypothetical protein BU14_0488s0013 [Porphyra umbilicalis]
MVPEICRDAVHWQEEVQMAAAEALYFVVGSVVPPHIARRVVIAALRIINLSDSGDVFDAWGEILSMLLPQLPKDDALRLVVPAVTARAAAPSADSRRLAARIIGALDGVLSAADLEAQFLPPTLLLCDDEDASVRAMIAQSVATLGAALPLGVCESHFWPKLVSLMRDENARVRAAALRALAKTAGAHRETAVPTSLYGTVLLPLFLAECSRAGSVAASDLRTVSDDTYLLLEIFAEVFGVFLWAVCALLEDEDAWTVALNALRRMVTCNGPTVRHWCAFNLPAVAQVCGEARPEKARGVLHALATDTDVETRATLAAGFHQTVAQLGSGPLRDEVLGAFASLITDINPQVRMNALSHLSSAVEVLTGHATTVDSDVEGDTAEARTRRRESRPGSFPPADEDVGALELAPFFASLVPVAQDSWRTQELLASHIEAVAHRIPQDVLCDHLAPLLFQMARESTYLVRKASMRALVRTMRFISDVRRRDHIVKHFRTEWARGKVYWTRLAYTDGAAAALDVYSSTLFRVLFGDELIALAADAVPNVRLRVASILPRVIAAYEHARPDGDNGVVVGSALEEEAAHCAPPSAVRAALDRLTSDPDPGVEAVARSGIAAIASGAARLTKAQVAEDDSHAVSETLFFVKRSPKPAAPHLLPPGTSAFGDGGPGVGAANGRPPGAPPPPADGGMDGVGRLGPGAEPLGGGRGGAGAVSGGGGGAYAAAGAAAAVAPDKAASRPAPPPVVKPMGRTSVDGRLGDGARRSSVVPAARASTAGAAAAAALPKSAIHPAPGGLGGTTIGPGRVSTAARPSTAAPPGGANGVATPGRGAGAKSAPVAAPPPSAAAAAAAQRPGKPPKKSGFCCFGGGGAVD